jgi:hypothetical protein
LHGIAKSGGFSPALLGASIATEVDKKIAAGEIKDAGPRPLKDNVYDDRPRFTGKGVTISINGKQLEFDKISVSHEIREPRRIDFEQYFKDAEADCCIDDQGIQAEMAHAFATAEDDYLFFGDEKSLGKYRGQLWGYPVVEADGASFFDRFKHNLQEKISSVLGCPPTMSNHLIGIVGPTNLSPKTVTDAGLHLTNNALERERAAHKAEIEQKDAEIKELEARLANLETGLRTVKRLAKGDEGVQHIVNGLLN